MTEVRVSSIMRLDFPVVTPTDPIRRAAALLVEAGAAAAPVISDDGRLVGILTQKDCFRSALYASYYREWKGDVSEHMTRHVVRVDAGDELIKVAEMFLNHPHRVFPVSDGIRVTGIIHRSDVLARLISMG